MLKNIMKIYIFKEVCNIYLSIFSGENYKPPPTPSPPKCKIQNKL